MSSKKVIPIEDHLPLGLSEEALQVLTAPFKTDLVNARRFCVVHGHEVRYNATEARWYRWDGQRWTADQRLDVQRLASEITALMIKAGKRLPGDDGKAVVAAAAALQGAGKQRAMLELARVQRGMTILADELDADPWLLNVANGILDLRTGELGPHDPAKLCTKLAAVAYLPPEECEAPIWEAYLDSTFGGDQALIAYLQKAVGYSLTGITSEQCFHLLHGLGANGKSTFLEVLGLLLGSYAIESPFETFLSAQRAGNAPRNDLARLKGARLVRSAEAAEGARFDEAVIKSLTGGDTIVARYLFAEHFEFKPQFKLWLAANHRPVIRGTDYAIWRRVRLVPFEVTIAPEKRDGRLLQKLEQELPGILRWAVQGCLAWQAERLQPPAVVQLASDQYRSESDVMGEFLADCCQIGLGEVRAGKLYQAYRSWCQDSGHAPLNETNFGRRLTERGYVAEKRGGAKYRRGLQLVDAGSREMF
jgi:putative DNA primase/helicase